jgi:hypothetical protein
MERVEEREREREREREGRREMRGIGERCESGYPVRQCNVK